MKLYRTHHQENAVRALAKKHKRVLIRYRPTIRLNPIRIRPLPDLEMFIARGIGPSAQLDEWRAKGGVVLYSRWHLYDKNVPHDAQLICECPFSEADLHIFTRETEQVAVVYRPPSWRAHENTMFINQPPESLCKRFWTMAMGGQADEALAKIIGLENFVVQPDEAILAELGITQLGLIRIRRATLQRRDFKAIQVLIPRLEPEDPALIEAYRFIVNDCPAHLNTRYVIGSALAAAHQNWKVALKALVRSGSVQKKATLGIYFTDSQEPDWQAVKFLHEQAKSKLARITKMVDELPEFKLE